MIRARMKGQATFDRDHDHERRNAPPASRCDVEAIGTVGGAKWVSGANYVVFRDRRPQFRHVYSRPSPNGSGAGCRRLIRRKSIETWI